MSRNKRIILIMFSSLCLLLLSTNFTKAQDIEDGIIGCCETKTKAEVKKFSNRTQAKCNPNPAVADDIFVKWEKDMRADSTRCVNKATVTPPSIVGDPTILTPQVTIPGSSFESGKDIELKDSTQTLIDYIIAIFKYAIGIIGIIAAIVLMFAGITWLTAGGNTTAISQAKTYIVSSLTGLILTLCSFLLLSTINNSLVKLDVPGVKKIQYVAIGAGCCQKIATDGTKSADSKGMTKEKCEAIGKDFQSTTFFDGYMAFYDDCISDSGCCRLKFTRKYGFVSIPGSTDVVCIENIKTKDCKAETSSTIWNYMPYNTLLRKDASMKFYVTKQCKDVLDEGVFYDDKCPPEATCNSRSSCSKLIKDAEGLVP